MGGKKDNGPSKKTEMKKKEKIVEDKTFGLKNKNKSKAVQKYGIDIQDYYDAKLYSIGMCSQ